VPPHVPHASGSSSSTVRRVSEVLLEPGETLSLEFLIPGRPAPLRAEARVAWVRRFPSPEQASGMGVEFVRLGAEERRALDALVHDG